MDSAANAITAIGIIALMPFLAGLIGLLIFYYVIRAAVREGMKQALLWFQFEKRPAKRHDASTK